MRKALSKGNPRLATSLPMAYSNKPLTVNAIVWALIASLLWSGNSVSIKFALAGVPPLALACVRFILGLAVVSIWIVVGRISLRMTRSEWRLLVQLTLIFSLQILFLNIGTNSTTGSRSTILISCHPFFVALFAHLFIPGDRFSLPKLTGMTLAFIGICAIFWEGLFLGSRSLLVGDLLVFFSSLLLGARQVYVKHLTVNIHPGRILFWQAVLSIPVFFLLSATFEPLESLTLTTGIVLAILYQGLVIAGICFIIWTMLIRDFQASRLGVFSFTIPPFGVLLSFLILKEALTPGIWISMLLVGAGVAMVNSEKE